MSFWRALAFHRHAAAWLFACVLLLPFAQAAARCHAYVHDPAKLEQGEGKLAPNANHCDLCLTAATLGSGVRGAEPRQPTPVPCADAPLPHRADSLHATPPTRAYRSRAPPAEAIGS